MPLDRLITVRITEIVGADDPTDPTAPVPGGGENILREEEVWAELLDNKGFWQDTFGGTVTQYNATVVYRVRYVDWLSEARVSQVSVPDRQGNLVDLQQVRDDTKGGRRRYLILEGQGVRLRQSWASGNGYGVSRIAKRADHIPMLW